MLLSPQLEYLIKRFEEHNPIRYKNLFGTVPISKLSASQIIGILSIYDGVIEKVQEFKVGDIIASRKAIDSGILVFFQCDDCEDIKYSGTGEIYYKLLPPYNKYYKV